MKAIVTGSTGFVGQFLTAHLEEEGDTLLPFDPPGGFREVLDREAVRDAIVGSGAEAVYHLAALAHVGESFESPVDTFRVNAEGTLNVLNACAEEGVGRVLVVGSADEYGKDGGDDLRSEDAPLRPISPYAASKVAAEFLALQAHLGRGLGTIATRSFNHTGPGQSERFVVPALARRIAAAEREERDVIEAGRLDSVREFNDVRDVVRAYRLLVVHGVPGEVYNVCSGAGYAISEVAERLMALSTRPLVIEQDPSLMRAAESNRLVGNPAKLKADTGWAPRYTLDETLQAVLGEAREIVGSQQCRSSS